MDQFETRAELIAALRASRAELEAALAEVGEARMTEPGAAGTWAPKDLLWHAAVYHEFAADELARITRGDPPDQAAIERDRAAGLFDTDTRNAADFARYKDMPPAEARAWAQRALDQLIAALDATPEDTLRQHSDWWTGGRPLINALDAPHDAQHARDIRAWLARGQ